MEYGKLILLIGKLHLHMHSTYRIKHLNEGNTIGEYKRGTL
jgi:hypothetical protein